MIIPVILAGGSGTRLWPLSRSEYPKQFLPLTGSQTMFQQTIARLQGLELAPNVYICNDEHRFIAAEQIRQIKAEHGGVILEPSGRDTAPAIALAAFHALKTAVDPTLLILAADQVIEHEGVFQRAVNLAKIPATEGKFVAFGISALTAETGYGYIKRGDVLETGFQIDSFVEKPSLEVAQQYVDSGEYYWNGGMFMFKASLYLQKLEELRPEIYAACQKAIDVEITDLDFIRIDEAAFNACPAESVDYAVMEQVCADGEGVVVPLDAGWNDVGSFASLWQVAKRDENGNSFDADVTAIDTKNTLVKSDERLVATIGVEDLVIIDSKDSLLVAHKDQTQQVKQIVERLSAENRVEVSANRVAYRPWGKYEIIDLGDRFQVKRITVNVGGKLSLQTHQRRAEHWVVVTGMAKITINNKVTILTENQSTYIPIGAMHALENPSEQPLELIEVQTGTYFGEDDIERFEDLYGRT